MNHITISEVRAFRECPRKHFYRYTLRRRPFTSAAALNLGSYVHVNLEQYALEGEMSMADADDMDPFDLAKARAMLLGYQARYDSPESLETELQFVMPLRNPKTSRMSRLYELAGMIDGIWVVDGGKIAVVEHKTSGMDISVGSQYWEKLKIDPQLGLYFAAAKESGYDVDYCIYNVLKKPTLRPYKAGKRRERDETSDEYLKRCVEAIKADPDSYFRRGTVVQLERDTANATQDIWDTAQAMRAKLRYRNPDACYNYHRQCDYFDVCSGCADIEDNMRFKTTERHEELV